MGQENISRMQNIAFFGLHILHYNQAIKETGNILSKTHGYNNQLLLNTSQHVCNISAPFLL